MCKGQPPAGRRTSIDNNIQAATRDLPWASDRSTLSETRPPLHFTLLGVRLLNVSTAAASRLVLDRLAASECAQLMFFANAHTLDLAYGSPTFRATLNQASFVFCDGVGVRLGARLRNVTVLDNLCGTDFVPRLLSSQPAGRPYRYYMLGATPDSISAAAHAAAERFPHWQLAGYRDGYFADEDSERVVAEINASRADLLLVGMGSPLQEQWLTAWREHLEASVCMGVGGLFDFWSGHRRRAAPLLRRWSLEWLHILMTERHKWRRYVLGNWRSLLRAATERRRIDTADVHECDERV